MATIGLSLGILNQQMFSIIVMVAIVTSFMAPLGLRLTMRKVRMTEEEAAAHPGRAARKGVFDPAQRAGAGADRGRPQRHRRHHAGGRAWPSAAPTRSRC